MTEEQTGPTPTGVVGGIPPRGYVRDTPPGGVECGWSLAQQVVGHDPHEVAVHDGYVWSCDGRGVVSVSPLCGSTSVHEGHAFDTRDGQWCAGWPAWAVEVEASSGSGVGQPAPKVGGQAAAEEGTLLTSVRADLRELDTTGGVRGSLAAMATWLATRMDRMGEDASATMVARLAQELRATMTALAAPRTGGEGTAMQDLLARLGTPQAGGPTMDELAAVSAFTKRIAKAMDSDDPAAMRDLAIELRDELALAVAGRRVDGS